MVYAFVSDGLLQHTKQSRKGGRWILLESQKGFAMNNSHEWIGHCQNPPEPIESARPGFYYELQPGRSACWVVIDGKWVDGGRRYNRWGSLSPLERHLSVGKWAAGESCVPPTHCTKIREQYGCIWWAHRHAHPHTCTGARTQKMRLRKSKHAAGVACWLMMPRWPITNDPPQLRQEHDGLWSVCH